MVNQLKQHKRISSTKTSKKKHHSSNKKNKLANEQTSGVGVTEVEMTHPPTSMVTPAQITLRPFSPEDQAWIMQVTKDEMGPVFQESYGYDLNLDNVIQYVHSAQTRMVTVNDQLAGYVSVVIDDGGKMNIGSLVLSVPHKRRGYGTRIMKLLEQEARGMGLIELEGFVQSSNQASINFLKKLGFQEVPSMQTQTIVMVKNLQTD